MLTASQLHDLLVNSLMRKLGGTKRRWRVAVGPVKVLDSSLYPHCNWLVRPSGSIGDISEIELLLDSVRGTHPLVRPD